MQKIRINIPEGIFYLSDYPQLLDNLPYNGSRYILNKVMTGCGATTMFLNDPRPTVLCSPRKELIRCKADSNEFRGKVHLFGLGEGSVIDKINAMKQYLDYCSAPFHDPLVPKILVTYDSMKHVLQGLKEIEQYRNTSVIQNFNFVIDEFQTIFTDASFRGSVEAEFMENIQGINNLVFLSATPYIEKYLDMLEEFKDIPYFELAWPDSSIRATQINKQQYHKGSPKQTIKRIIERYKSEGCFESTLDANGVECFATESVFFVNSVKFIISTIRDMIMNDQRLMAKGVNVICADTPENKKALDKIGLTIGHAPKRGEQHPAFTFVTKASFEGTDFYSTNACTYIFSDIKRSNMAIDISLDLPQIMGRQRLDENPFKYKATLFYSTIPEFTTQEEQEFFNNINDKSTKTDEVIQYFNSCQNKTVLLNMANKYRACEKTQKYEQDYISVVDNTLEGKPLFVFNKYVRINELRAWEVQKEQYTSDVYVMNSINNSILTNEAYETIKKEFLPDFDGSFEDKMKKYAEYADSHPLILQELRTMDMIPIKIRKYYDLIGSERLRALSWKEANVKRRLDNIPAEDLLTAEIRQTFVADWYSLKEIKTILQGIYDRQDIQRNAKATDLATYFTCTPQKRTNRDGTRDNGYALSPK